MIATTTSIEGSIVQGESRTKKLSVTAESWDHLSTILQDSLYTDKILAPIREYSTNAMDAHVEAGKPERPILIRLPNRFCPTFAVRDFGLGMDESRVWDVFCNYGSSTKRNTNEQVGMLGIGSKSAFAYPDTNSFTVVSFQKGVKTSYICHKGGCAAGELVQLARESTDEEDGLEIQIPIHTKDIDSFISTAAKFFAHWTVMPIFEGNQISINPIKKKIEFSDWYHYSIDNDNYSYSKQPSSVLMGNISYTLPTNLDARRFDSHFNSIEVTIINNFLQIGSIVFKAPIGSVEIAANRETLQIKDKTIKYIGQRCLKAAKELEKHFDSIFDSLTFTYERKLFSNNFTYYGEFRKFADFSGKFKNFYAHYDLYNKVGDSADASGKAKPISTIHIYSKPRRGRSSTGRVRKYSDRWTHQIALNEDHAYLVYYPIDGVIEDKSFMKRIAPLIEQTTNKLNKKFKEVLLFIITDKIEFNKWCDEVGFDYPLVNISTLPEVRLRDIYPKLVKTLSTSYRMNNSGKNDAKCLEFVFDKINKSKIDLYSLNNTPSLGFEICDFPKFTGEKHVYVVIDRYYIDSAYSPKIIANDLNTLVTKFGITLPSSIYAFRLSESKKLDSTKFEPLVEYIKRELTKVEKSEDVKNYTDLLLIEEFLFNDLTLKSIKNLAPHSEETDDANTHKVMMSLVTTFLSVDSVQLDDVLNNRRSPLCKLKTLFSILRKLKNCYSRNDELNKIKFTSGIKKLFTNTNIYKNLFDRYTRILTHMNNLTNKIKPHHVLWSMVSAESYYRSSRLTPEQAVYLLECIEYRLNYKN